MVLYRIRSLTDPFTYVVKDDPVRPHIPLEQRINEAAEILILRDNDEVLAATCMQWLNDIPTDESDLVNFAHTKDVAVFYTIWSYTPGCGAQLLMEAAKWLREEFDNIKAIVTLSPKTELARSFHLKNGAIVYRENPTSTNYQYYRKELP